MNIKKIFIIAILFAVVISLSSVSAADVTVTPTNNNTVIQGIIDNANTGDNITFEPGTYNNVKLTVNKGINMYGYGANINGDGSNSVFTITDSIGLVIGGFNINVNTYEKNGITGSNVQNAIIENNTIEHGGDGINIYKTYANLTIKNNTINDMQNSYGDGISLVNHNTSINMDNWVGSTIENNKINNVVYGIFIGGNFKGTIKGNTITNASIAGMHFQGKRNESNGILIANVSYNTINNANIGINMFHPGISKLNIDYNIINAISFAIQNNSYTNKTTNGQFNVNYNYFLGEISQRIIDLIDSAYGNIGLDNIP